MKAASSTALTLTAFCCAVLLPVMGACGSEAPPPTVINNSTAGQSSAGTGAQTTTTAGSGSGGSLPAGTAGTTPVGGSGAGDTATGGAPQAGNASTTAGNAGTAGAGVGGASSGGSGGAPVGGAGGSSATAGAAGTAPDLLSTVGGPLSGQMMLCPCLGDTDVLVCQTKTNGCPGGTPTDPLSGVITTDKMITLGGDPAKLYTLTLHVQGEVEAKAYPGGKDQESSKASPAADGFAEGGKPEGGNNYNVYMARVASPAKDYFFNAVSPPGKSDHTTYGIDYTAKIQANGGTTIRLVAADSNCSMIKNCGPNNNGGTCNAPIVIMNVEAKAKEKNPTFDFTKAYNGQWVSLVVTDVTSN